MIQLCDILSRSNLAVRSYGQDTDLGYVCTVTLTKEIWPWVKIMTHPWVMDNNCVKYYPDPTWSWGGMAQKRILSMRALWPWPWRYDLGSSSWHTLGSWATIVWNIIQIRQVVTKLWPGHNVNRRTDRQGDSYIQWWFVYLDTFVSGRYFRINEFSGLLNRPFVQTWKSVPTIFSGLARFPDYRSPD